MTAAKSFRPNCSRVCLALVSAVLAAEAGAAAGRVEFAFGDASVTGPDGRTRPAARGAELDSGDVVRTTDGRVQIRMSDGAYISLQPNTEFGIKNYRFEGKTDGSEPSGSTMLETNLYIPVLLLVVNVLIFWSGAKVIDRKLNI